MEFFSTRNKILSINPNGLRSTSIQLRERIWNVFYKEEYDYYDTLEYTSYTTGIEDMMLEMGIKYEFPANKIYKNQNAEKLHKHVVQCEGMWYRIYDFIEKYLRVTDSEKTQRLTIEFNRILEEEVAPYRILNGLVVPIIGKSELNSIGETIDLEYESVSKHMTKALELYSDRKKPDYENSVKESISSVESMCSIITGLSGGAATLGKDHSEKLYERLKAYAENVFLMTGNNSKKEHKKILEQMHQVDKAESLILIATGSLVGEGFDFPRLDTLFMATPVSFRGVVEQYAGRLNRDYAGKENVIIYDYVDNHITMFNNMYMKRLKAYKQIGYEIAGGLHNDKQTANAIYDGDNYAENYHKDLLDANKNIIISSPAISGTKVYELINLLKEKQLSGVQITIVTWAPDSYGFGDASYWMQLHEEMRKAGFYIKTVEESCERFAVIDQEVVWYGNINLLAKDKVDDSIMRVLSKEIASELMEITFGDNG